MKLQNPTFPCNHGTGPREAPLVRNMEINYWAPCFILLICLIFSSTEGTRQLNHSPLCPITRSWYRFFHSRQEPVCLQRVNCGEKEKPGRRVLKGDSSVFLHIRIFREPLWISPFDGSYFKCFIFYSCVARAKDSSRTKSRAMASAPSMRQLGFCFQGELFPLPSFSNLLFLR